jgi:hypothetical protein
MWANGRTDRRTDMTELIIGFCNFAKASKKGTFCCVSMVTVHANAPQYNVVCAFVLLL